MCKINFGERFDHRESHRSKNTKIATNMSISTDLPYSFCMENLYLKIAMNLVPQKENIHLPIGVF